MEEKKQNDFLQDSQGDFSSKRLASMICIFTAIALAIVWCVLVFIVKAVDRVTIPSFVAIIGAFLAAGLAFQGISLGQDFALNKVVKEKKDE